LGSKTKEIEEEEEESQPSSSFSHLIQVPPSPFGEEAGLVGGWQRKITTLGSLLVGDAADARRG
jgi:hypothetical protein